MPTSSFLSHRKERPCPGDSRQSAGATETVSGKRLTFHLSSVTTLKAPNSLFSNPTPKIPRGKETNSETSWSLSPTRSRGLCRGKRSKQPLHFSSSTIYRPRRAGAGAARQPPRSGESAALPLLVRLLFNTGFRHQGLRLDGDPASYLMPKTEGFCFSLLTTTKLFPGRLLY